MIGFDFRIGTKLSILTGLGVLLVSGMLVQQQIGGRAAVQKGDVADNQQYATVEALRAAGDLRLMQLDTDEVRLATAPGAVDRALAQLRAHAASAGNHFDTAMGLGAEAQDKERLQKLSNLAKDYAGVVTELAAAAKTHGDTVAKVRRAARLGDEMEDLIDQTTYALVDGAAKGKAEARALSVQVRRIGLGIGLFVIVVLAGVAVFGTHAVARPIRRIGEVLRALADGNKDIAIPFADRADEVGDTARAAEIFKQKLIQIEMLEGEQTETERRLAAQRRTDMNELAGAFETTVAGIVRSVSSSSTEQLEAAAQTLSGTAGVTRDLSAKVSSASTQASENVQSVAQAAEQLIASVNEISRQVQESSRIARDAVGQAQKTDGRIAELTRAASRIGDVVKLITAIAEQTNLLALNATIEAARAGQAGKGFAIVAQEVKALAAQTSKATDEIGVHIAGVQAATQDSVATIKEIGGTIDRISDIASTIAAAVEEQAVTTRQIADNVQAAAKGAAHVATNIAEVNDSATGITSASAKVLASAQTLTQDGSRLSAEMERFLAAVRAA